MTPQQRRRRIDEILDAGFLSSLPTVSVDELREKLRDARTEEDALSYIRRNLHGRLDLLRAELDLREGGRGGSRGGRGGSRGVEALAAALADNDSRVRGGRPGLGLRAAAVAGRRRGEQLLSEDHLARLPDLSVEEIAGLAERISGAERTLSAQRHRLHEVIDVLESELARRYKDGLEPSLERLR